MRLAIIGCSFAGGVYSEEQTKVKISKNKEISVNIIDAFKGWPYELHKKYNIETHLFSHIGDGLFATRFFIDEIIHHYGLSFFDKIIISTSVFEPRVLLYKDYKFGVSKNKNNFFYYDVLASKDTVEDYLPNHINLWQLKENFDRSDQDLRYNLLAGVAKYARSNYARKGIVHILNYIDSLGPKFLIFPYGWLDNEFPLTQKFQNENFLSYDLLKKYKNFKCFKKQSFTKFLVRNYDDTKLTVMDGMHHNEEGQKILLNVYLKDILEEFLND